MKLVENLERLLLFFGIKYFYLREDFQINNHNIGMTTLTNVHKRKWQTFISIQSMNVNTKLSMWYFENWKFCNYIPRLSIGYDILYTFNTVSNFCNYIPRLSIGSDILNTFNTLSTEEMNNFCLGWGGGRCSVLNHP